MKESDGRRPAQIRQRLKQGGYAALVTAAALLLAVSVNLLAGAMDQRWALRLDLTGSGLTVLSDETIQALSDVDQDVSIYLAFRGGSNSELRATLESLAQRYRARNRHISVHLVDPVAQPGLVNKLIGAEQTLSEGSVIVTNADASRVKLIPSSDLYTYSYDESSGAYSLASFDGEAGITSAILYAAGSDAGQVLMLTGHDELIREYCSALIAQLERENFETRTFELGGAVQLEADDVLLIITPAIDLTDSEYAQLEAFLSAGGRMMYVNDPSIDMQSLPNFSRLLASCALGFQSGVVVEDQASTGNYLSGQLYLVPNVNDQHEITAALSGTRLILPGACAVTTSDAGGYLAEALLTSSHLSFLKPTDYQGSLTSASESDPRGPFTLAAAAQREGGDSPSRVVAVGNLYAVADSEYIYSSANLDFSVSAIQWLANRQPGIQVRSKALGANALEIPNARTLWLIALIVIVLIPGAVAAAGAIMYAKRKRL
jgi:ABC-2 type transport system permease protein